MGGYSAYAYAVPRKIFEGAVMKQITPTEFLAKVESGDIKEIFSIGRRVYGTDYSYSFERAAAGKLCECVYADVP